MDAVELLIRQHREIEGHMDRVVEEKDPQRRARLAAEAGDHLGEHIASEEEVFYPAVRARRTEDILLESLEEHLSLKRLLADLVDLPARDATYLAKFKVLKEQTEHHHKEEEEHLFPKVGTMMDAAERAALGEAMLALQKRLRERRAPREAVSEQTDRAAPLA